MALLDGKHVMLSYNWKSQKIVSKVCDILKAEKIPVWFDIEEGMKDDIYKSMAEGVENAAIVCCFMSPEYQESKNCKLELKYAQTQKGIPILPCIVTDQKGWKPSGWLELITTGLLHVNFEDDSEENIRLKTNELIDQIKEQPSPSKLPSEPTYLAELVKYEYTRNARIERIMDPEKSFPIEQSYINLAILKAKEQHKKVKQLHNTQHNNAVMGPFEEIYCSKTAIDVRDIFKTCKNQAKQVLVFGRAGIGKSTFCRYAAYQWAIGAYWSQYELVALIPLHRLTAHRYPLGKSYSLIDLVKKEVFSYDLSEKDNKLLEKQFDAKNILWILDGYDEIVQNVPPHLKDLFEQLLKTPHHILTSRPYLNTLSYDVQMEITGFTDGNIMKYVRQFFDQMKRDSDDALIKSQTLLSFLKINPSIWGLAHIPVNLELICSIWSNEDLSETKELTITALYSTMIGWLCRRYLTTQNVPIQAISKKEVYQRCQKELSFLESLAFNVIESNSIIIRPTSLEKAFDEAKISLRDHLHVFNMGILKSFKKQGIGTQIETDKDHYFIHLSFQEYFAARYLINTLKGSSIEKAIQFIKHQKYNQRYALVFTFMSGLLSESDAQPILNIFWDNILGEPLDLVGIRHMQLIISCIEETSDKSTLPRRPELLAWIAKCIKYSLSMKTRILRKHLSQSLQRVQSLVCDQTIMNIFINLLQCDDRDTKTAVLAFISELKISNPSIALITSVTARLDDKDEQIRANACEVLWIIGKKSATNGVISKLASAVGDESGDVREKACEALGIIGENAATNGVISKLVIAIGDESDGVREKACEALGKMGEKAATNQVISKLVSALGDESFGVTQNAYKALVEISEKAATNEVLSKLVNALGDESEEVRQNTCEALGKMGAKAATSEVISNLVSALDDESYSVRLYACEALGDIGEKSGTNEVISKVMSALGDESEDVRRYACQALGKMGEKAATNEVISKLVSALEDASEDVRQNACKALGQMGEEAATNEVISKLVSTLEDASEDVRQNACKALGQMGEKAATNEVISKLVSAMGDDGEDVRQNAYKALVEVGEKAVTNEVISQLVSALKDESEDVRQNACQALGKMAEKAGTNEVISKLVSALEDESEDVRGYACKALGQMGEKAATDEVITELVSALEDVSFDVRAYACQALGKMGEKAATNKVISKLVSALEDVCEEVRQNACQALGQMGEKAVTNEVISKLVSALEDESEDVRQNACKALGQIGDKAATNEVISKLVSALVDKNDNVKWYVCETLGKMGEKAATNEVISKLVNALGDASEDVRVYACKALGKMGEKAGTNEVISKLVFLINNDEYSVSDEAANAARNILSLSAVIVQLAPKIIADLCSCEHLEGCLKNVSEEQLINGFFTAKNYEWLSAVSQLTLLKGAAVTVTEDKVVVYGSKEPSELRIPDLKVRQQLIIAFTYQAKRVHLSLEMPSEALPNEREVPSSSVCDIM